MNYFDKIPTITYDGRLSKNLLSRAQLSDKIKKEKAVFYPYTMEDGERLDILSNDYYETPNYTWLIMLTNNIIDPYYDVALQENDFFEYIKSKYGSYEAAARKIYFYRNNWVDNIDTSLTVQQFNSLSASYKKYYDPVLDNYLNVQGYKRKRYDDQVSTNKIITITVSNVNGTFTVGEEVQTSPTDYAFVTNVTATTVSCQHVNGTIATSITGQESGATADVDSVTVIHETLASTDAPYWQAITYFEYEQELNEQKKYIKLLDPRYAKQAENDLRRIMSAK